jgi:hypothetical protein
MANFSLTKKHIFAHGILKSCRSGTPVLNRKELLASVLSTFYCSLLICELYDFVGICKEVSIYTSEAVRSFNKEIALLLWYPKILFPVQKSPTLSHMNLYPHTQYLWIHFDIILPFTPRSLKWRPLFGLSYQNVGGPFISFVPHACYMSRPSLPP